MPTNHGAFRRSPDHAVRGKRLAAEEVGVFRYGISRLFDAMTRGSFLAHPDHRKRSGQLEYHFRELCQRFVFSLQHLSQVMQEMTRLYAEPVLAPALMATCFEAGTQADHVLSYLGNLVDDVAVGITLATGYFGPEPKKPIDSMGGP
jgi:hypothetical protein